MGAVGKSIDKIIPVAKPLMDDREAAAARRAILSGWVTQGPEVAAFEREFAAFVGCDFACAVSSCTTALHLALLAVGVQAGHEVITVSHSFIATANSIRYCNAIPVFVDIDPVTFNIDPGLVESAITQQTRAILAVHQMGMPCDILAVREIASRHHLPLIEDAACAIGSEIEVGEKWERIGRPHGDIACFSFHPRKLLSTGDGGMVTCSNAHYDREFRLLRQHGMSVPDAVRHQARDVIFEDYPILGFNYRMTDIQAAIGREQLKRLPEVLVRRRSLASRYQEKLKQVPGIRVPEEPTWAHSNWQSFCTYLPDHVDQRRVMQAMLDAGISTRRGVMCAHREPAYGEASWYCGGGENRCSGPNCSHLKHSERAQDTTIILPLYHELTETDQDYIVEMLADACRN